MTITTPLLKIAGSGDQEHKTEETSEGKKWNVTNLLVLKVTCASFLIFVLGEIAGAIIGKSWSLLGDAAAMSVDVMTYFTNMLAERIKAREGVVSLPTKMILEVYVPSFSVCALLGVTAYVTVGAVHDLLYTPEDDDVNIYIMYGFAVANAVVDVVSVYMFWLIGKNVFKQDKFALANVADADDVDDVEVENGAVAMSDTASPKTQVVGKEKNLNMISAFTHVGGDSLRTISIFVAAVIASLKAGAPYKCDAWAAIVVTVTIVFMVMPLIREIYKAYWRIRAEMAIPK
jgi:Co/Zn/Cd efflux system component